MQTRPFCYRILVFLSTFELCLIAWEQSASKRVRMYSLLWKQGYPHVDKLMMPSIRRTPYATSGRLPKYRACTAENAATPPGDK